MELTPELYEELSEFAELWDDKERRAEARNRAGAFVDSHSELEARFGHLNLEEMVAEVDFLRARGRVADLVAAEMWIQAMFEPQKIGGRGTVQTPRRVKN